MRSSVSAHGGGRCLAIERLGNEAPATTAWAPPARCLSPAVSSTAASLTPAWAATSLRGRAYTSRPSSRGFRMGEMAGPSCRVRCGWQASASAAVSGTSYQRRPELLLSRTSRRPMTTSVGAELEPLAPTWMRKPTRTMLRSGGWITSCMPTGSGASTKSPAVASTRRSVGLSCSTAPPAALPGLGKCSAVSCTSPVTRVVPSKKSISK
mmetsp:Transcript_38189/g.96706  ORF Transcript_38189/g.96706 Transcript_38189/m.96706 type:complete len:209 (-) Transcript_38189:1413-2039(-)